MLLHKAMKITINWSQLLDGLEQVAKRFDEHQTSVDPGDRQVLADLLESYEPCRNDYERYVHFSESG